MRTIPFERRRLLAISLALAGGLVTSADWSGAEGAGTLPRHARALSLVIEQNFREPGGVTKEAEKRVGARPANVRSWRVRAAEGREDRFDVIFYIGDRPACVWRVDLSANRVIPDGCSLELWEEQQA